MIIGVISDTHGLLRPKAVTALHGAERIIHVGDVGAPEVLTALAELAPVTAVRGNNDHGGWATSIATTEVVNADGLLIYVLHDVKELDLDPAAAGIRIVVFGHSHRPAQETRDGVLWFNPGSAGPRRFQLPVAVGRLTVADGEARGESAAKPAGHLVRDCGRDGGVGVLEDVGVDVEAGGDFIAGARSAPARSLAVHRLGRPEDRSPSRRVARG